MQYLLKTHDFAGNRWSIWVYCKYLKLCRLKVMACVLWRIITASLTIVSVAIVVCRRNVHYEIILELMNFWHVICVQVLDLSCDLETPKLLDQIEPNKSKQYRRFCLNIMYISYFWQRYCYSEGVNEKFISDLQIPWNCLETSLQRTTYCRLTHSPCFLKF